MKSQMKLALRLSALLLCVGMLLTFAPVGAFAAPDEEPVVLADSDSGFNILGYMYDPSQRLVYNGNKAFQRYFGFNKVYDMFTAFANVYADTMRLTIEYDGEEWMIQLWKGAYATILAAGGEIGVYNRPAGRRAGRLIEHYNAAHGADDLLGVSMTMYNNEQYMFTRAFGKRWWTTGFQVGLRQGIQSRSKPRSNLTMDCRIQLKSAKMANLVAAELRERGFRQAGSISSFKDVDTFTLSGDTVRIVWRYLNQSYY